VSRQENNCRALAVGGDRVLFFVEVVDQLTFWAMVAEFRQVCRI